MARRRREHSAYLRRQRDGSEWRADAVHDVRVPREYLITNHPTEGPPTTDNIKRQPQQVTLVVTLTKHPLAQDSVTGGSPHLQDRLRWLTDTGDAGDLVDIITTDYGILRSFAIQTIPTNIGVIERFRFDLGLREVQIATVTSVEIIVDVVAADTATGAPDEVDVGEQATVDTSEDPAAEEQDQSILAGLVDALL